MVVASPPLRKLFLKRCLLEDFLVIFMFAPGPLKGVPGQGNSSSNSSSSSRPPAPVPVNDRNFEDYGPDVPAIADDPGADSDGPAAQQAPSASPQDSHHCFKMVLRLQALFLQRLRLQMLKFPSGPSL